MENAAGDLSMGSLAEPTSEPAVGVHKRRVSIRYIKDCPLLPISKGADSFRRYVFDSLQEVRDMTADWLHRYNHHRPHEALGRIPPVEYRVKLFPNLYF